jgi:hypothetical protein
MKSSVLRETSTAQTRNYRECGESGRQIDQFSSGLSIA